MYNGGNLLLRKGISTMDIWLWKETAPKTQKLSRLGGPTKCCVKRLKL